MRYWRELRVSPLLPITKPITEKEIIIIEADVVVVTAKVVKAQAQHLPESQSMKVAFTENYNVKWRRNRLHFLFY